jgi:aspartate ammonia-lyase
MAKGSYQVINPNDDVNMSQSTNDAYPTAFRVATYTALQRLAVQHLAQLQQAFEAKAGEFNHMLKMGRTQLQDAVPMTVGQEFGAFAMLLAEERNHLKILATLLLEVNLGATAIGTGINTPDGYSERVIARLGEVTGLPVSLATNLIEATSDCGAYVSAHSALKRVAVKLSKICNDLRLLSSGPRAGLGEIRLPERAAGSSIMPAKVNPVIPEVVNQLSFKVIGNDMVVTLAAEAGQLQLNAMEPVIAQAIFESITLLANGADCLRTKCVDGITVNTETCAGYVHNSIGLVTFLNPVLGHAVCDDIGKECARTGKSVRQVVLERGLVESSELDRLFSFDNMTVG